MPEPEEKARPDEGADAVPEADSGKDARPAGVPGARRAAFDAGPSDGTERPSDEAAPPPASGSSTDPTFVMSPGPSGTGAPDAEGPAPDRVGKDSTGPTMLMPGRGGPAAGPAAPASSTDLISSSALARVVVEKGLASAEEVEASLEELSRKVEEGATTTLAEILVEKGLVDEAGMKELEEAARSAESGERLGSYELLGKLGEGGMGAVYRARQVALDRTVALKILPERLASNVEFVNRFEREAKAVARLDHPNVVRAIDAGEVEGRFYFAMEFVEGESLEDMLAKRGRLPEEEALGIAMHAARGLEAAWRNKLVHRDIKPDNILVTKSGVAKIADLGLAREADLAEATRLTQDGAALGTPHYISPEQARGEDVDIRTDIYALGVTLYRAVTGEFPFKGKDPISIIMARFHEMPKAVNELNPEVSHETALVIATMMEPDREHRYPDPVVLLLDLERAAEGQAPQFAGATDTGRQRAIDQARSRAPSTTMLAAIVVRKRRKRELAFASLGLLAAAGVVAAALLFWWRPQEKGGGPPGRTGPGPEEIRRREALEAEAAAFHEEVSADFDEREFAAVVAKVDGVGDRYAATEYGPKLDRLRREAAAAIEEAKRKAEAEARTRAEKEKRYRELVALARENITLHDFATAISLLVQAKGIKDTEEVERLLREAKRSQYLARAREAEAAGRLADAVGLYERALAIEADEGLARHVAELRRRIALADRLREAEALSSEGAWTAAREAYLAALELATDEEAEGIRPRLERVELELRYRGLLDRAIVASRAEKWQSVLEDATAASEIKPEEEEPKDLIRRARLALGPPEEVVDSAGIAYVLVPAGELVMGSDSGDPDERPVRKITLGPYYVSRHEVTNAQYEEFDPRHRRTEFSPEDDMPVVAVSWHDADAFCRWLSKKEGVECRLPTEAEWEGAARLPVRAVARLPAPQASRQAGTQTGGKGPAAFPWGDVPAVDGDGWRANIAPAKNRDTWAKDGHAFAAPVGSFERGASPSGCHDLAGNVWEWCQDWYDESYYKTGDGADPSGPESGERKVLRGGSFANSVRAARSANRAAGEPGLVEGCVGFRVVREIDPVFTGGAPESEAE
jgi:serine/threonine-protein kinase